MDLKGQLSNPPEKLETLVAQGTQADRRRRARRSRVLLKGPIDSDSTSKQEVGRYSNPASSGSGRKSQRRLKPDKIDELLIAYRTGDLVRDIAVTFGVSRTTVIDHVTRAGLPLRSGDDWTAEELGTAASLYAAGHSLAAVGQHLGVDKSTVANRFQRAGLPVRRRRGWT